MVYPQNTYLTCLLELGGAFVDFSDYEHALLNQHIWLFSTRVYWDTLSVAERSAYLERRGVPPDATWDMYEEMLLKNDVVYSINLWRSRAGDPYMHTPLPERF